MDVKEILAEKKKLVDREVMKHIPNKEPRLHYEMMRDYPSRGGKWAATTIITHNPTSA